MSEASESLLTFPCDLPIKVFGRNEQGFRDAALTIVRAHYGSEHTVTEQLSKQGAYLSLTVTVRALDRAQVDAVFQDLVASEQILMVL
jgi:putative lipoic acid-binding regulatory protein